MTSSIASVLNHLIETCKDGQNGFRAAADAVSEIEFKTLFVELATQRQQFSTELQTLVSNLGEEAAESGTTAAALHRGWIGLKSAVSGRDTHAILAECERGEDAAVAAYRETLGRDDLSATVRKVIDQQALSVQAAHDRVRSLRDRLADQR